MKSFRLYADNAQFTQIGSKPTWKLPICFD